MKASVTRAKPVERQSGVALWRQIADRLRVAISEGEFDKAGMLPPAFDLAERFGVNRHTVRAALAFLGEEGLVETIQGQGTRILSKARLTLPISRRTRFSAGIGTQAGAVHIRVIASVIAPANQDVRALLKLEEGAECVELEEVGYAGGRAVSCSQHFFPAGRFAAIADHIRETGSITRAFAACGLPDYLRQSTEISARHADARERDLLRLAPGAIILEARAVNIDPEGRPVQCSRTRFAADRISLRMEA